MSSHRNINVPNNNEINNIHGSSVDNEQSLKHFYLYTLVIDLTVEEIKHLNLTNSK